MVLKQILKIINGSSTPSFSDVVKDVVAVNDAKIKLTTKKKKTK